MVVDDEDACSHESLIGEVGSRVEGYFDLRAWLSGRAGKAAAAYSIGA
jgi:hypothetical protein